MSVRRLSEKLFLYYPIIIFSLFLIISASSLFGQTAGIVIGDTVRVRSKPRMDAQTISYRYRGNEVFIQKKVTGDMFKGNPNWYRIKANDIYEGYVHAAFVLSGKSALSYSNSLPDNIHDLQLKTDFNDLQFHTIKNYQKLFKNAKSDKDLKRIFDLTPGLSDSLEPVIQKKYDSADTDKCRGNVCLMRLSYLYYCTPGLYITVVAEGTIASLFVSPEDFRRRAALTKGNADDMFFELMENYYGKSDRLWPAYTARTWDYGGDSLLGQGVHLRILEMTDRNLANSELFKQSILEYRKATIQDITDYTAYYENRAVIIKELKEILKRIKLNHDERVKIENRLQEFQKQSNPSTHTNCKVVNCPYG